MAFSRDVCSWPTTIDSASCGKGVGIPSMIALSERIGDRPELAARVDLPRQMRHADEDNRPSSVFLLAIGPSDHIRAGLAATSERGPVSRPRSRDGDVSGT